MTTKLRSGSYLNLTTGRGFTDLQYPGYPKTNRISAPDINSLGLRGELKSARIIRHDNDSSLIYNDGTILKYEVPSKDTCRKDQMLSVGSNDAKMNRHDSAVSLSNTNTSAIVTPRFIQKTTSTRQPSEGNLHMQMTKHKEFLSPRQLKTDLRKHQKVVTSHSMADDKMFKTISSKYTAPDEDVVFVSIKKPKGTHKLNPEKGPLSSNTQM